MSALKNAHGKWLSLSIPGTGAPERCGCTRLAPLWGRALREPAGLPAGPEPASRSVLNWWLHADWWQGTVQIHHGWGSGCWAPISAAHLFWKNNLLALTVLHVSTSDKLTSICPSCLYGLPISWAISCWACLHLISGPRVVVLTAFTSVLL